MQAGFPFTVVTVVPRTQLQTPSVMTGAEQQDISFAQCDPLRLLRRLELFRGDRLSWL